MDAIDNTETPNRRIEDHTPDAKLDWTKPDAPAVPAAPARAVPLRAVASMCVKEGDISVFPTPAAKDLAPGHYMLSASAVERAQSPVPGTAAPAAPAVPVIDAPRVEDDEKRIVAAARALSKLAAESCQVNEADLWKLHGEDFKIDARAALAAADALPIARQAQPTDLSKRMREAATAEVVYPLARLLIDGAEEIERYYGGMMAWKRTAEKKDRDWNEARMARENDRVAARAQPTDRDAWISVDERLPEKYCLAVYKTARGQQRIIRAMYVKQYEIEATGDECDSETNDANDMEYIKAGWYECIDNWGDYSSVAVCEGVVTYWTPLPALPALKSEQKSEQKA